MPERRVALVTGSTSGIGLGVARALAARGMDLVLNGFGDAAQIEKLRAALAAEFKARVAYNGADMSKPEEVRGMIAQATREMGRIDVLVNNAGIQHTAKVHEFPVDRWNAILAINLSAAFHGIAAVLPQMLERNWGRIINVASVHGLVASKEKVAYVAAKHGIVGMTKVVATEAANHGVTCNAICPGWVLTPLVQKQIEARAKAANIPVEQAKNDLIREKQPMLQFSTPEQIGALAVYLASDAAQTITGTTLSIDGGWVAQ